MIHDLPIEQSIEEPLITHMSDRVMAVIYCVFGLAITAGIALRWRAHVWALDAPGNRR